MSKVINYNFTLWIRHVARQRVGKWKLNWTWQKADLKRYARRLVLKCPSLEYVILPPYETLTIKKPTAE